ncbi:MAG: sugar transferase, partial [Novosphingobium sp.]|nr:sugar transferase [Novosphingobium sp.]
MTKHVPMGEMRQSQDRRRITLPLAPPLEQRRLQLYIALLLIDGAAVMLGLCTASWLYLGRFLDEASLVHGQVLLPIYWTIALTLQVYTLQALRRINFARVRAVLSLIAAESALLFVGFATKSTEDFSRVSAVLGLVLAMFLLIWVRGLIRPVIKSRCGEAGINILLIDDGGASLRVPHAYHIDAREHHLAPDLSDPHMMDRLGLYMMNMDRVMVTCPSDRRSAWALVFKSANVSGEIVE